MCEQIWQRELAHSGTPHEGATPHSGRYKWGSGEHPFQTSGDFLSRIEKLEKEGGLSQTEIAKALGMSTTQFRAQKSLAKNLRRAEQVATAQRLRDEGLTLQQIAEKMGFKNDSSVRSLLNEKAEARMNAAMTTAASLKKIVAEKGMIDVGVGVERELGISEERLKQALALLQMEGYEVYGRSIPQVTNPGRQTTLSVLCPPGTEHSAIYDTEKIKSLKDYISDEEGTLQPGFVYPESMDSSRLQIRYAEEGGLQKDGLIELRRNVDDLSLGDSHYAQVRILVDGDRYLKGMAVYSDNMPDGVDVVFNTNKKLGTDMRDVLKKISSDPDNPFGSLIKEHGGQSYYTDENGKKKLSLINKRAEEGDWDEWDDTLASQFLGKQSLSLIKKQLDLAKTEKEQEYKEICDLDNPAVKKAFLETFANDCDAAAIHLKSAALPRQKYQVIMPLTTLGENEVYAPNYKDGETLALVRFPHGGTFEIPILKVNNRNKEGINMLSSTPTDAVGISAKTAERLSGADFDGDTVLAIPCNSSYTSTKIKSTDPLEGLEGFDPKLEYGGKKEGTFKAMTKEGTQMQMGSVSNLITDMTLKGADEKELARAVRHSMVVIDAYKHKLDYKQSEIDNDIAGLKKKYQGHYNADGSYSEGASTLLSRAKGKAVVLKRVGSPIIDKETGEVSYKTVVETYVDKNGKTRVRTQDSTQMAETRDAYTLSSGTPQESLYADYANSMKQMANNARKEYFATGKTTYSAAAKKQYSAEVESLDAKLNVALSNAPRERQAQVLANSIVQAKKQDNPDLTKAELKKIKQQALTSSRAKVGAKRTPVTITDNEWTAIQAGAISESKLEKILNNCDLDSVRQKATPKSYTTVSASQRARINNMKNSPRDYTTAQIAEATGLSVATVSRIINGKE